MEYRCKDCGKFFSVSADSLEWNKTGSNGTSAFEAEYEERCDDCLTTHRIMLNEQRVPGGGVENFSIKTVGVRLLQSYAAT